MFAVKSKIFLVTISIFAITIISTIHWYNFLHEDFIFSGRHFGLLQKYCIKESLKSSLFI